MDSKLPFICELKQTLLSTSRLKTDAIDWTLSESDKQLWQTVSAVLLFTYNVGGSLSTS